MNFQITNASKSPDRLSAKASIELTWRLFINCAMAIALFGAAGHGHAQSNEDDPLVGTWVWVMDQEYEFEPDGTFSGPSVEGTWKYVKDDGAQIVRFYELKFKGDDTPEEFELKRGDREGREFTTGQAIRLGRRYKISKVE